MFPNFASVVRESLASHEVHVTAVAGCFPTSQSFIEVKVKECEMAVEAGADEIDIVLALNSFMAGDEESARKEIRAIRAAIDEAAAKAGRKVTLKVILETGLLVTPENIANASFLAMEEGADFIKTSTGKVSVNATPMAAYVMCESIKAFYDKTGRKVGFKAAGGISTSKDAVCYHSIVKSILGNEWMNKDLFRFGVSRPGQLAYVFDRTEDGGLFLDYIPATPTVRSLPSLSLTICSSEMAAAVFTRYSRRSFHLWNTPL